MNNPVRLRPIIFLLTICLIITGVITACDNASTSSSKEAEMSLSSLAFKPGGKIPDQYSPKGQNISPPLAWDKPPQQTRSLAILEDDPDAPGGNFTHWIIYNIPANIRQLNEGVPLKEKLTDGTLQGRNDFGWTGYAGPNPPEGKTHRYRFIIFALDTALDLDAGATKVQLFYAMNGHILAQGQLIGMYGK
jgi:Raf kinase inhibitor-like YbhB/YbcL family protein